MDDTANTGARWSLQGNVGRLIYGPLSGEVDTSRPHSGLSALAFDSDHRLGLLLGVIPHGQWLSPSDTKGGDEARSWPLPLAETYVRGNDLVATYRASDNSPFSSQLYWRTATLDGVEGVVASISLLVSLQTQLLDTRPQISVVSLLSAKETLCIDVDDHAKPEINQVRPPESDQIRTGENNVAAGKVRCVLRRLVAPGLSYAEIMPSADYFAMYAAGPNAEGDYITEWTLFADFLEKGVIRRARVHAALLPRENDIELATICCLAIERLELPLTT